MIADDGGDMEDDVNRGCECSPPLAREREKEYLVDFACDTDPAGNLPASVFSSGYGRFCACPILLVCHRTPRFRLSLEQSKWPLCLLYPISTSLGV